MLKCDWKLCKRIIFACIRSVHSVYKTSQSTPSAVQHSLEVEIYLECCAPVLRNIHGPKFNGEPPLLLSERKRQA